LSAANSVRLANALVKEQGIYEGEIAKDDVEALVMIGQSMMGVDAAACHQLALTAKNNLKKMTS
jgi:L-aminopeptidase/D-esterase-like protein